MQTPKDIFDSLLQDQLSPSKLVLRLIKNKLKDQGIIVSDNQAITILEKLSNTKFSSDFSSLEEDQLSAMGLKSQEDFQRLMQIDLSNSVQEIEGLRKHLVQSLREFPKVTSRLLLTEFKRDFPAILKEYEKDRDLFRSQLADTWQKPLMLLELILNLAIRVGDEFDDRFRPIAEQQNNFVFAVLTHSHVKTCQIVSEILTLLKAGYAQGAYARCRSLHEIVVLGRFIVDSGNEIAERFILHDTIQAYKAARQYQEHHIKLGGNPLSNQELQNLESARNDLISRFGRNYKDDYGWAMPVFEGRSRITFRDIEEKVGLEHLRPFYRMASHYVHAKPTILPFRVGNRCIDDDVFQIGPSIAGLSRPAIEAALSVAKVTATFLKLDSDIDEFVACEILYSLADEIEEEFTKVEDLIRESQTVN